jgi:hypothetical protein
LDRGFVEVLVERLVERESTTKELVATRDRHPRHVVEDLVDADSRAGVRVGKVCPGCDETHPRVAGAGLDLRAVDKQDRVPAPAARLCADLVELGDGAHFD